MVSVVAGPVRCDAEILSTIWLTSQGAGSARAWANARDISFFAFSAVGVGFKPYPSFLLNCVKHAKNVCFQRTPIVQT